MNGSLNGLFSLLLCYKATVRIFDQPVRQRASLADAQVYVPGTFRKLSGSRSLCLSFDLKGGMEREGK